MRIAVAIEGRKARIPHQLAWPMGGARETVDVPDDRERWDDALVRAFDAGLVVEVPIEHPAPAQPRPARGRRAK